jgi:hypothetical protein
VLAQGQDLLLQLADAGKQFLVAWIEHTRDHTQDL